MTHFGKTIHSPENALLLSWIKQQRVKKNLSGRTLSKLLNAPHTWVSKIESGERRLDVIEYLRICHHLDVDPCEGLRAASQPGVNLNTVILDQPQLNTDNEVQI